jgi:hypothetical protein
VRFCQSDAIEAEKPMVLFTRRKSVILSLFEFNSISRGECTDEPPVLAMIMFNSLHGLWTWSHPSARISSCNAQARRTQAKTKQVYLTLRNNSKRIVKKGTSVHHPLTGASKIHKDALPKSLVGLAKNMYKRKPTTGQSIAASFTSIVSISQGTKAKRRANMLLRV